MPGYNLRSRKVETFLNNDEDTEVTTEKTTSPITSSAEISNENLLCELESLRENNKNLYSKYNNASRSKSRMRNIITEKDD